MVCQKSVKDFSNGDVNGIVFFFHCVNVNRHLHEMGFFFVSRAKGSMAYRCTTHYTFSSAQCAHKFKVRLPLIVTSWRTQNLSLRVGPRSPFGLAHRPGQSRDDRNGPRCLSVWCSTSRVGLWGSGEVTSCSDSRALLPVSSAPL